MQGQVRRVLDERHMSSMVVEKRIGDSELSRGFAAGPTVQAAAAKPPIIRALRSGIVMDIGDEAPFDEDPKVTFAAEELWHSRLVYRFVKRIFDIAFSVAVLVGLSWLFAIVAIAIKLDDPKGPVFFKQRRVGLNGREFDIFKFRSMCVDAEAKLAELRQYNEKTGPVFKMTDDPRITRVGHFIRKTSIDELPQFLNVLLGDLSVVGPRPALPAEVAAYTPRQRQRLLAKAGLTCYWQTRRNRDSITFDEWVELDLLYILKCGVWTDIKLIIQTVGVVLMAQGS